MCVFGCCWLALIWLLVWLLLLRNVLVASWRLVVGLIDVFVLDVACLWYGFGLIAS